MLAVIVVLIGVFAGRISGRNEGEDGLENKKCVLIIYLL